MPGKAKSITNVHATNSTPESTSTDMSTPSTPVSISSTPKSTEISTPQSPWEAVRSDLFYFPNNGERTMKNFKRHGRDVSKHLFTIDGYDFEGGQIRIEVWGDNESEFFEKFFAGSMKKGNKVFKLPNTEHIPDTDTEKLVLVMHPPNEYQAKFKGVLKLQTKSKLKKTTCCLNKDSFPRAVVWKEGLYFNEDGSPVRHPSTWEEPVRELVVDSSCIDLDSLLDAEDIDEGYPPLKKQKK